MKKILFLFAFLFVLAAAAPIYAQNGCIDSPENPTALLAVLGTAGALIASARSRFRRK
ncbi:MAG TPA: PExPT-CTERM protein [Acidobacteriaceae bacterium]